MGSEQYRRARALPIVEADGLWAIGGAKSFATWVARHHGVSAHAARAEVRRGRTLRDTLPVTTPAASSGEITLAQAQVLATRAPTTPHWCDVLADPDDDCDEAFGGGPGTDAIRRRPAHAHPAPAAVCAPDADVPAADHIRTSDQRRAQALADVAQLTLDRGLAGIDAHGTRIGAGTGGTDPA